jgi:hypothetical protein
VAYDSFWIVGHFIFVEGSKREQKANGFAFCEPGVARNETLNEQEIVYVNNMVSEEVESRNRAPVDDRTFNISFFLLKSPIIKHKLVHL